MLRANKAGFVAVFSSANMFKLVTTVYFVSFWIFCQTNNLIDEDEIVPCLTSNSTQGYCVNSQMCPFDDISLKSETSCGFNGTIPKICCPLAEPSMAFLANGGSVVESANFGPTTNLDLDSYCLTPNATRGECIVLKSCPTIYKVSSDFTTPLTIETFIYLRDSLCGFDGTNPKVCCPVGTASNRL